MIAFPARAQERVPSAPEWLTEVAKDVRLGARLEGGIFHGRLSIAPLEERGLRYLGRPVQSELSPATSPIYGASVGLRWDGGAELFGVYRLNSGLEPKTHLRFQDDERAIPSEYDVRQWTFRAQYFLFERVGFGVLYRGEQELLGRVASFEISGEDIPTVFSGSSTRRSVSLYVPARFPLAKQMRLLAQIGATVYGTGDESYNTSFTYYQDPERPAEIFPVPPENENASIRVESADLAHQFVQIGVEHSLSAITSRLLLTAEHVSIGEVSEEWRGGVRVQVGLPF